MTGPDVTGSAPDPGDDDLEELRRKLVEARDQAHRSGDRVAQATASGLIRIHNQTAPEGRRIGR